MITCAILDDISNLYNADYHHTIVLCSGTENYNLLKKILAPDTIYSTCSFRSIPTKYYTERIDIAKDKKGHLRHLKSAEDDNSTEQNNLGTCYGTHAKDEKGIWANLCKKKIFRVLSMQIGTVFKKKFQIL